MTIVENLGRLLITAVKGHTPSKVIINNQKVRYIERQKRRHILEETILSMLNQDCPNMEHIIVDGGSTDNTLDMLCRCDSACNLRWLSELDGLKLVRSRRRGLWG